MAAHGELVAAGLAFQILDPFVFPTLAPRWSLRDSASAGVVTIGDQGMDGGTRDPIIDTGPIVTGEPTRPTGLLAPSEALPFPPRLRQNRRPSLT